MTRRIKPGDFRKAIQKDASRFRTAVVSALYQEANDIMSASVRVTPMDTGTLRQTAFVTRPETSGGEVVIELGYGGAAKEYALIVHEMPKSNSFQEPGTGPKYLERPMDEAKRGQLRRIQERSMRAFERLGSVQPSLIGPHKDKP